MNIFTKTALFAIALQAPLVSAADTADVEYFASNWNTTTEAPLSSAVRVGNMLYMSGALGLQGNKLAEGGITGETQAAMRNIERTLKRHGATLDDIVKCTVYLADMAEWAEMNAAYIPFFPNHKPARSAFGGNELGFNGRVEIECFAVLKD